MNEWLKRWWFDGLLIGLLMLLVVTIRLPIVAERKIMPAGDAFNYQFITSHLLDFTYPPTEKRLPVYPILLIGGRILQLDPIRTSIGLAVAASAGVVAMMYLLGRAFAVPRAALLAFVGLSAFDPFMTMNAIRPFADSLFVFLALLSLWCVIQLLSLSRLPSKRWIWGTGIVLTLMMFTRYEGFLIAAVLILCLFVRRTWKEVALIATIPTIITLLWIPVHFHVHGSLSSSGYLALATESQEFGEPRRIPQGLLTMAEAIGWGRVWSVPASELEQPRPHEAAERVLLSPTWWTAVLALVGTLWLFVRFRWRALPVFAAGLGYAVIIAWWFVYSRYNPLLIALFYLTAALGVSALITGMKRLLPARPAAQAGLLLVIAMMWVIYTLAPPLYATALSRAWDGNRKGYALYQAIQFVNTKRQSVVMARDYPMAVFTFGLPSLPLSSANPDIGLYLSNHPEETIDELYQLWRNKQIQYVIENEEDPRIPEIVSRLRREGKIVETHRFQQTPWDTQEPEVVLVHRLRWETPVRK
jgi:hypothetical protein